MKSFPGLLSPKAEAKTPEEERRKQFSHAQMMAAVQCQVPPRVPWVTSKKDKCHIYWAQSAPIRINLLRLLVTKAINQGTGQPVAPQSKGTEGRRPLYRWLKPEEAPSSRLSYNKQTDVAGPEQRVQMDVVGESSVFLLRATATHSILTSFSESFSKQTCTSMGASDKPFSRPASYPSLLCLRGICILPQFLAYAHSWRVLLQKWNAILSLSLGESHGPHPGDNLWETWGALLTNEDMKNLSGQTAYNKSTQGSGTKSIPKKSQKCNVGHSGSKGLT